jgi:large subunit ribosomal protein L35
MPKSKTKSGAKKRFQVTGTGKIKRKKAFKRHILTKKETARKRALGNDGLVHASDAKSIKRQLLVP